MWGLERLVSFFKVRPYYLYFAVFCAFFFFLFTFVELRNGKFWTNDLLVYYGASVDYFKGKSPYLHPYGLLSGFFKYPPPSLYFFTLFPWMPFSLIQFLHLCTSFFSFVGSSILLHLFNFRLKKDNARESSKPWVLWLSFFFIAIHLTRELHLGNINLQLLFLFCLGLVLFDVEKYFWAGLCWAIMVLFKPFFLMLVFPFIFKHLKFLGLCTLLLGFIILLPLAFQPMDAYFNLWKEWFAAALDHSSYQVNYDAFSSIIARYTTYDSIWIPSLILLSMCLVCMIIDLRLYKRLKVLEWVIVLLALSPSVFKTDTQHFIFSTPLFFLVIQQLICQRKLFLWFIFGLLMMGYSLNSNDLWGKEFGHWISESGFLGISNLGIVFFFLSNRFILAPLPSVEGKA